MQQVIKTIFIGTPDFGIPAFEALIKSDNFQVIASITQPDKKIGRKQILTKTPVKVLSEENNIPVLQPEKIKEITNTIEELSPDLIVVIAYAQIIPQVILNIAKLGCVNVHGSLLPKYRGAACIQAALLNNEKETGITIMQMEAGLDTGPIIDQQSIKINRTDTTGTLFDELSNLGGEFLVPTLLKYVNNELSPVAQDDSKASYVGLLKKSDGNIDFNQTAKKVQLHQRAMSPWPGAFTNIKLNGKEKILKILDIEAVIETNDYKPGELFKYDSRLAIQCSENAILVNLLQLEGKKPSDSAEFLRGYNIADIEIL